jgi:peptidyl-prolyl cis-trans isomerase A (cyclophilin A)
VKVPALPAMPIISANRLDRQEDDFVRRDPARLLQESTFVSDTRRLMRAHALIVGVAALAVAAAVEVAGQGDVAKLSNPAALNEQAPPKFRANFDTTKGAFVIEVTREWAPIGADRFYNLVKNGFYNDVRFFRVISGFMAQFGMHGTPAVQQAWQTARLKDDPVKQGSNRGYVVFAHAGPNTRTTQLFINFRDNRSSLDSQGFAAFGQVVSGMDVVDKLHAGYGDGAPRGKGPDQGRIAQEGNAYLAKEFPNLDYIKSATIAN